MCGIAGTLYFDRNRPVDEARLGNMADAIAHRGPDAEGFWIGQGVGLAHRRLSIIDLAEGQQPLGNEDGSIQVVFNGEIYNYRELKSELVSQGHKFRTNSDTEVLVHLYEEMGEHLVDRLRGMFAFAIWDSKRERLVISRDRVGQKPVYYYQDAQQLLFGSEIKSILTCAEVSRELDLHALEAYLTFGVVPNDLSIFRSIRKLPAAHTLVLDRQHWNNSPQRYWELKFRPREKFTLEEWLEELSSAFQETVTAHRIADVPIGAFLSGGLDSSAVVAALMQAGNAPIKTFSIGFEEEAYSELPYARLVAQKFGTEHIEETVTADAASGLADLVHFYDEPFADSSAIPTMAVCRAARKHVKVVLSGDGGDEAFGGYSRYAHDLKEARLRALLPGWFRRSFINAAATCWPKADWLPRPLRLKTVLTNLSLDAANAYANTISLCRPAQRALLLNPDIRHSLNGHRVEEGVVHAFHQSHSTSLNGMLGADIAMLLPDDFLTKVDRASMAVGLEVRPPLVDHQFLELAAQVPSEFKILNGETKWIFKKMCERSLPSEVIWRKKQGFEIPVDSWLRGPLREDFEAQVLSPNSRIRDYINIPAAHSLYESHLKQTGRQGAILWSLLVLGRWLEEYLPNRVT